MLGIGARASSTILSGAELTPETIELAVEAGKSIRLIVPILNEPMVARLGAIIRVLVARYGRPELEECLQSCIIELATNASRANMKHAFFIDASLDPAIDDQYRQGVREFKQHRQSGGWHRDLSLRARDLGLFLEIVFRHSAAGIRIEVINNLPLLPQDEARIREKLRVAMRSADIFEFYSEHGDDTEGQGLGFAMNVLFLRSENIDPRLLRIGSSNGRTTARLEVPLRADFVAMRQTAAALSA